MARKYSRDNRGRFASSGGGATARGRSGTAPKRIKLDVLYHGTTAKAAVAIKSGGYRESSSNGIHGRGVYTTSSKKVAKGYAMMANDRSAGKAILRHRVPRSRVGTAREGPNQGRDARELIDAGKGARLSWLADPVTLMGKGLADKTLDRSSGKISRQRRGGVRRRPKSK